MASGDELSAQNRANSASLFTQSKNLKQTTDRLWAICLVTPSSPFCSVRELLGRRYNVGVLSNLDTCNVM